jgi:hypothetical protein
VLSTTSSSSPPQIGLGKLNQLITTPIYDGFTTPIYDGFDAGLLFEEFFTAAS